MAHAHGCAIQCLTFIMRRLKNAFLAMLITVGLIICQCRLRAQWSSYVENSQILHAKSIGRRGLPDFGDSYAKSIHQIPTEIVFAEQPMISGKLGGMENRSAGINFAKRTKEKREKKKRQWALLAKDKVIQSTHEQTKSSVRPNLKQFWLDEFTSQLPRNLQLILQDILLRDFERKSHGGYTRCVRGFFRLNGMDFCQKWLQCDEIEKLVPEAILGSGVGKIVHAAKWRGKYDIAIATLRKDRNQYKLFVDRVQSGVENLLLAQTSPYATQVVGLCERGNSTILVMESCSNGNFRTFYSSPSFRQLPVLEKFKFAIQMVAEYDFLHRGLGKPRVHCDIHTIMQAFGQWVVSDDLRLFLNDLDEMPVVDREKKQFATCECEPYGIMEQPDFLAPEIRYTQAEFEKAKSKKPVDEASDIWKIPDLTANILVTKPGKRFFEVLAKRNIDYYFKSQLEQIHDRCKEINPAQRPNSKEILVEYLKVYERELKKGERNAKH